jgi:hypothetical protein
MKLKSNLFKVKLFKVNQPTSTRYFEIDAKSTFEEIMVDYILEIICVKIYKYYYHEMIGQYVTMKRVNVYNEICLYSVVLRDLNNLGKILFEYKVEIDCIKNSNDINLADEKYIIDNKSNFTQIIKEKSPTNWFLKERSAIRMFLMVFSDLKGDVKEIKKRISKATYHRHIKYCKEKGYIVNGKLVRKITY